MFLRLVFLSTILFISSCLHGQITESFESWVDGGYAGVSNATLASGDWENNNSYLGTIARTGTNCVRFNDDSGANEYLEYQGTDGNGKDNGLATVSFWYRHWDGDGSSVQFQVQYNQSGSGWTNIGGVINVTSTVYAQFSSTPNIVGNDILVRVISIADAERLCIDDFEMTDYVSCSSASEPTTNSTTLNFSNITCASIDLSWTNEGNGTNHIVVASTSPITGTPNDQTDYTANSTFGSGDIIAAGVFVVYNGNGNSVSLIGLSSSTTYYFAVFEYNGTTANCTENYFTSSFLTNNSTTLGPASQPTSSSSTLNITNIGCFSMDLDWTIGNGTNRIVVASTSVIAATPTDQTDYTANSTFGSGNTIAAGEFVVYNGTGNSFTITGLSMSTTYYFAVFEYNGTTTNCTENYFTTSLTGNNTTNFCASSNPEITGILVDACGSTEGTDEFFTFTNGTSNMNINDLKVTFPTVTLSPYCNSGCGSNTWVTNSSYVTQLNDTASCAGLFVEADPIPANANVVVFSGSSPAWDFDFSSLCGSGPYYAIFANNTASSPGRFGNWNSDCSKIRTLTVEFGGGNNDTVSYQSCSLSHLNGDFVSYDDAGNPTYGNDGCSPSALLPIKLLEFKGEKTTHGNLLEWTTSTEINNDYFTLEKSTNAIYFNEIGTVNGAGNSYTEIYYQFIDDGLINEIDYYRLKQTDFDGAYSYSNIIALSKVHVSDFYFSNNDNLLHLNSSRNQVKKLDVFTVQGQLIKEYFFNENEDTQSIRLDLSSGFYIVSLRVNNEVLSKKIVITD